MTNTQTPAVDHAGIAYFGCARSAENAARVTGWPTDRIFSYGLGWAVQRGISGEYLLRSEYLAAPSH